MSKLPRPPPSSSWSGPNGSPRPRPVNDQEIPIWIVDYVLLSYGTGAIMAVPGQGQRDWDFARVYDLPIIRTVEPPPTSTARPTSARARRSTPRRPERGGGRARRRPPADARGERRTQPEAPTRSRSARRNPDKTELLPLDRAAEDNWYTEPMMQSRSPTYALFLSAKTGLQAVVSQLVEALKPRRIYLSRSRADGRPCPDSDFDLMVVFDDEVPDSDEVYARVGSLGIGYGSVTCRESEFEGVLLADPRDPRQPAWDSARRIYEQSKGWTEIVRCLEEFPSPDVAITEDGDVMGANLGANWVFRGLADSSFSLKPAIEREADCKSMSWRALEELAALEFKSRARMHFSADLLPDPLDKVTWLAQMQHYGIPTRLLDFTYSPFVALYFAIREQRNNKKSSHVRLWAIDAAAVNERFYSVTGKAYEAEREEKDKKPKPVTAALENFATDGDIVNSETQFSQELIKESMLATGTRRVEFEERGCVAVVSPPVYNPRLASQQGIFLVNLAEGLSLCESLNKMMVPPTKSGIMIESYRDEWCKLFDIPAAAVPEIEQRLFQMNIHEQSLFPDIEGLAGLIRQKIRLHWK